MQTDEVISAVANYAHVSRSVSVGSNFRLKYLLICLFAQPSQILNMKTRIMRKKEANPHTDKKPS